MTLIEYALFYWDCQKAMKNLNLADYKTWETKDIMTDLPDLKYILLLKMQTPHTSCLPKPIQYQSGEFRDFGSHINPS